MIILKLYTMTTLNKNQYIQHAISTFSYQIHNNHHHRHEAVITNTLKNTDKCNNIYYIQL